MKKLSFKKKKNLSLLEGSVWKHLVRLGLPMVVGLAAIFSFNIVDTYFVARLGTKALAAISFTFPVVAVLSNLTLGLGIGASSVISRAIGKGDQDEVKRLTTISLILALCVVAVFVIFGFLTIDPLFRLLGASDELLPLIREYMEIWYAGLLFLVVPMIGNSAIRATGDTLFPSIIMVIAAVANTVFDPILIFGLYGFPALELKGAALATVLGRSITLLAALLVLHYREQMILWQLPKVNELKDGFKRVLHIGAPAALNGVLVPLSAGVATWMVARFGAERVAGFGVATRIEGFSLIIVMAISTAIGPFIGQNFGANKMKRIKEALFFGYSFSIAFGLIVAFLLYLFKRDLGLLFNANESVLSSTVLYLSVVPISFGFFGMILISGTAFNAMGKPGPSLGLTFIRLFVLYLPVAYGLMLLFDGVLGVYLGVLISNLGTGLISVLLIRLLLRRYAD